MGTIRGGLFLFFCVFIGFNIETVEPRLMRKNPRVCTGTNEGLASAGDEWHRYNMLKYRYQNCTYVEGNLEIKELFDHNMDLSFLESIEEVSGYVLISSIFLNSVPLTNLRIIRGSELFNFRNASYSLYVVLNARPNSSSDGLLELGFRNLTEISEGKVYFFNNELLCYHKTIFWADLNPYLSPPVKFAYNANHQRKCPKCDPSCYNEATKERNCWGRGKDMCQRLNHQSVCHGSCDGRCFGTNQNECCHPECAAGCSGPRRNECYACKNFDNGGECVDRCPEIVKYNKYTMQMENNPDGKYSYGTKCVDNCPDHLLKDRVQSACVKSCKPGEKAVNKTCVKCDGFCPKRCKGLANSKFVNSANIKNFSNCTIIEGNLRIVEATFEEDIYHNIPAMNASQLYVLQTVKEITGYLMVQSSDPQFTNLSFLSNLEVIHGRYTDGVRNAINIVYSQLRSLELLSLKSITNGGVFISRNPYLCFAHTINYTVLFHNPLQSSFIHDNRSPANCSTAKQVCDEECKNGCWGKGPNKCLMCKHMRRHDNNVCLLSCTQEPLLYQATKTLCKNCDEECNNSCTGPGPEKCDSCKNVYVIGTVNNTRTRKCVKACPDMFYADSKNECKPCHANCDKGCSGPSSEVTAGGCHTCKLGIEKIMDNDKRKMFCLPEDTSECAAKHFLYTEPTKPARPMAGKQVCKPCHYQCSECYGQGARECTKCENFREGDYCVANCYHFNFGDKTSGLCRSCNSECREGCVDATTAGCKACKNYKVYTDEEKTKFNCTSECPPDKRHKVYDDLETDGKTLCAGDDHPQVIAENQRSDEEAKKRIAVIAGPTVGGVILLGILLAVFGYYWRQRARAQEKTARLTAKMTGYYDEPVTPTSAKPDMACLRLIKENELRRGGIIGSGAFGTVYKGFWIPSEENVKIPVAIKVLQEGTSPNQNKELLEEARVMASVENPCCIRILAVCMTAQMMLITQLMPLGCLLDYVRKHKENVGSKVLLNWCTQIAKGMAYLEERGIVHRDLAARNVLVQSPGQVKITDFGLAKLLDYNEDEYHAAGGKMPIKWLALECIQHRIFTHKSDVWSYGVTVWELFTYGQRPYENVRARDVPDLLEKGERLPQPNICTIDVYMIMIKCWMLDADSRPSFVELAEEFAKMARDPGRYLVIAHDKLMRLPSHSYDKNDLARSLSVKEDGPEEVVEAEDYLQPQSRNSTPFVTTPVTSKTPLLLDAGAANFEMKDVHMQPRREKRYGHLESAAAARKQREASPTRGRGNSVTSRYSSDPVQILREKDEPDGRMMNGRHKSPLRNGVGDRGLPVKHGDVQIQLPVDEDDYLQPKSSKPRAYMDLMEAPDYVNDKPVFDDEESHDTSQYVQPDPVHNFDNPEYFENQPEVNMKPRGLKITNKNRDYYNDLTDKRQRPETKPLVISDEKNSETAV